MPAMYEVIMNLPLFKGISHDHVSAFLEKTHIEFVNYSKGEDVIKRGTRVDYLTFVISGSVSLSWSNSEDTLGISYECGVGTVLGARYLYGMERNYPFHVKAVSDNVSVLRFSKAQYMSLIRTEPIYIMNYLNYLSLRAQMPISIMTGKIDGSLLSFLKYWCRTLTTTDAINICLTAGEKDLKNLTNISGESLKRQFAALQSIGVLQRKGNQVYIESRTGLLECTSVE
jgi:CRP-like cAMP-binding protein